MSMTAWPIHVARLGNKLGLKWREERSDGSLQAHYERVVYRPTYYTLDPDPLPGNRSLKTIHEECVKPVQTESLSDADAMARSEEETLYGNISPINAFLCERFPTIEPLDASRLDTAFIDIEVESSLGFSTPADAKYPVQLITVRRKGHSFVYGLHDYTPTRQDVTYLQCKDEAQLLQSFVNQWGGGPHGFPDILTGWYVQYYDIPYLVNRITALLGEDEALRLSPWKQIRKQDVTVQGRTDTVMDLVGVPILDYHAVYRKFTFGYLPSYTLDYVAEHEKLKVRKISYEEYGSLSEFHDQNYAGFVDYNLTDVDVVEQLDVKKKMLQMIVGMAHEARVNFIDTFKQVRMWDVMIYRYLLTRGIVVPPRTKRDKKEKYGGAYVKDPQVGRHRWVASFDVAGLYPALMRQWSISPDTFIERSQVEGWLKHAQEAPGQQAFIDGQAYPHGHSTVDDLTYLLQCQEMISVDMALAWMEQPDVTTKLSGVLRRLGVTLTPNKQIFWTRKQGFFGEMLGELGKSRADWKKRQLAAETEAVTAQEPRLSEVKREAGIAQSMQMVKKVQLNSAYGAIGNEFFRFFDVRQAEAVTMSGQFTIRLVESRLNAALNGWFKTTGVDYVIASDTDSVYLNLAPLVPKETKASTKIVIDMLDRFCKTQIEPILNTTFTELFTVFNGHQNVLSMKREVLADTCIWLAKKRYFMNVWDSEGVRYDEPKMKAMGVEMVKSSTPLVARSALKAAFELLLRKTEPDLWSFVAQVHAEYQTAPFERIAFPRGMSKLEEFEGKEGQILSSTPIHVRGSLHYNQYLKETKLGHKYPELRAGEKVRFAYLKMPNPLHSNVISVPKTIPKEWGLESYVDREMQYQKSFLAPLKAVLDLIGWTPELVETLDDLFGD
jgi:DNA polymerase elongation subunit (family B)